MAILIPTLVISILGLAFGLLLGYAGKKFAVDVDERVMRIRDLLPGANCGGCGNPSCDAYAALLAAGKADVGDCAVNSADNSKAIGVLLGVEVKETLPSVANVLCQGDEDNCQVKASYDGLLTCKAASALGGNKGCAQACLGLGDCVKVCTFDALSIHQNIAEVDSNKCTACGTCVKECPRQIIRVLPKDKSARVLCRTTLNPRESRAICKTACIKCQLCVRSCPESAISFVNDQIEVDREKCTSCGICIDKCPTDAILLGETQ